MTGILGLPPGLRGYMAAQQADQEQQAANFQKVQGILALQGSMEDRAMRQQMQPLQMEQLRSQVDANKLSLTEKQQRQGMLGKFAETLPEAERSAFMLSPDTFLKERFAPYTLKPGEQRMVGKEKVAGLDPENKIAPNGQVYSPRAIMPGQVFADPNKPFSVNPDGRPAPNLPFQQFELSKARAGKTDVTVNTDKSFFGHVAQNVGNSVAASADQARGAVGTINTVRQITDALNSGKVMTGPTTTARVFLGQLGETMGINGADATEKLTNTRKAIQGLAQLELDAAQQMKGQGQITEAERAIIRRAASGDIDGMTAPELKTLAQTLDKTARYKIRYNKSNVDKLREGPEGQTVSKFMDVQEPEPIDFSPKRRASDKEITQKLNGKTYVKRNGQWFEQ